MDDWDNSSEESKVYSDRVLNDERQKNIFMSIVSHDVLNNLTTLKSFCELKIMESEGGDEDSEWILNKVSSTVKIIEDARLYANLRTKGPLEHEKLDLRLLVNDALLHLKEEVKSKDAKIHIGFETLMVNSNILLRVVFYNIISNAIKFGPQGGNINIDIMSHDPLRITVSDEGEGTPDSDKKAIFERFKTNSKKGIKGLGIGLGIVREVMKLLGGIVWVEDNNKNGKGSVFVLEFPEETEILR